MRPTSSRAPPSFDLATRLPSFPLLAFRQTPARRRIRLRAGPCAAFTHCAGGFTLPGVKVEVFGSIPELPPDKGQRPEDHPLNDQRGSDEIDLLLELTQDKRQLQRVLGSPRLVGLPVARQPCQGLEGSLGPERRPEIHQDVHLFAARVPDCVRGTRRGYDHLTHAMHALDAPPPADPAYRREPRNVPLAADGRGPDPCSSPESRSNRPGAARRSYPGLSSGTRFLVPSPGLPARRLL